MVTLCIEPHLFTALRAGFDAAVPDDARIKSELLDRVRTGLTEASATALPGLPVVVTLASPNELDVLAVCFEVGAELHPGVTADQWDAIQAMIEQAARSC